MKQLFNNENRIAVIIKNIEMQSVCSVESLAAKLDVSQKTIRNDIKELNCLLGGYACISNNKGTCKLIVFAPKGFTEIRNKIYKQEDLFNFNVNKNGIYVLAADACRGTVSYR